MNIESISGDSFNIYSKNLQPRSKPNSKSETKKPENFCVWKNVSDKLSPPFFEHFYGDDTNGRKFVT